MKTGEILQKESDRSFSKIDGKYAIASTKTSRNETNSIQSKLQRGENNCSAEVDINSASSFSSVQNVSKKYRARDTGLKGRDDNHPIERKASISIKNKKSCENMADFPAISAVTGQETLSADSKNVVSLNKKDASQRLNSLGNSICAASNDSSIRASKTLRKMKSAPVSKPTISDRKKSIVSMFETIAAEETIKKKRGEFVKRKPSSQFYREIEELEEKHAGSIGGQKNMKADIFDNEPLTNSRSPNLSLKRIEEIPSIKEDIKVATGQVGDKNLKKNHNMTDRNSNFSSEGIKSKNKAMPDIKETNLKRTEIDEDIERKSINIESASKENPIYQSKVPQTKNYHVCDSESGGDNALSPGSKHFACSQNDDLVSHIDGDKYNSLDENEVIEGDNGVLDDLQTVDNNENFLSNKKNKAVSVSPNLKFYDENHVFSTPSGNIDARKGKNISVFGDENKNISNPKDDSIRKKDHNKGKKSLINMFENIAVEESKKKHGQFVRNKSLRYLKESPAISESENIKESLSAVSQNHCKPRCETSERKSLSCKSRDRSKSSVGLVKEVKTVHTVNAENDQLYPMAQCESNSIIHPSNAREKNEARRDLLKIDNLSSESSRLCHYGDIDEVDMTDAGEASQFTALRSTLDENNVNGIDQGNNHVHDTSCEKKQSLVESTPSKLTPQINVSWTAMNGKHGSVSKGNENLVSGPPCNDKYPHTVNREKIKLAEVRISKKPSGQPIFHNESGYSGSDESSSCFYADCSGSGSIDESDGKERKSSIGCIDKTTRNIEYKANNARRKYESDFDETKMDCEKYIGHYSGSISGTEGEEKIVPIPKPLLQLNGSDLLDMESNSDYFGEVFEEVENRNVEKDNSWINDWIQGRPFHDTSSSSYPVPINGNRILCLDDLPKARLPFSGADPLLENNDPNFLEKRRRAFSSIKQLEMFEDLRSGGMEVVADQETRDIISDTLSTCNCNAAIRKSSFYGKDYRNKKFSQEQPIDEESERSRDSRCSSTVNSDFETAETDSNPRVISKGGSDMIHLTVNAEVPVKSGRSRRKGKVERCSSEEQLDATDQKSTTFSTMFGCFNYSLFLFILNEYGAEKWKQILSVVNLSRKQVAIFEKPKHNIIDDKLTDRIIRCAANLLCDNLELFLQKLGTSYFDFSCTKYGDILKSVATNIADFINNMDDIRRHIHKIEKIPDHHPPSIHASIEKNGNLLLYYHSHHDQKYLEYFIIGFLKAAALQLYKMRCRISLQQERTEDYSIISIKAVNSLARKPSAQRLQISNHCEDLVIKPHIMDDIFPFHMILDSHLNMIQIGISLSRLLENYIPKHGLNIKTYFKLVKPAISFCYTSIQNNLNTAFILCSEEGMFTETFYSGLILKGQMAYLSSSNTLWFMASPQVYRLSQLNETSNIYLSDIPLHDATREVLLISEQTHAQDTLKSQLQVLTNRLKETSKELALGKINTETILDEIFPKYVAEQLMKNLPVPAVTAEEVSILFTDIVGFTAICGKSDPEEITDMLNNLYLEFDVLCEKYEVYKVETIGDAYMAVGGIHQKNQDHGRNTTLAGIEMIARASNVLTPAGDSIKIRVGIHSGPVVAGVVGTRMPRYCLFGNNVTLANKMESTSEMGKVHISPATYLKIKHHMEFIFFWRKRDVMPPLMQKLYKGNTYFVTQKSPTLCDEAYSESDSRLKYMKIRSFEDDLSLDDDTSSRRTSFAESVLSDGQDYQKYPEALREQLQALEMLNGYQTGKVFSSANVF